MYQGGWAPSSPSRVSLGWFKSNRVIPSFSQERNGHTQQFWPVRDEFTGVMLCAPSDTEMHEKKEPFSSLHVVLLHVIPGSLAAIL